MKRQFRNLSGTYQNPHTWINYQNKKAILGPALWSSSKISQMQQSQFRPSFSTSNPAPAQGPQKHRRMLGGSHMRPARSSWPQTVPAIYATVVKQHMEKVCLNSCPQEKTIRTGFHVKIQDRRN